MSNPDPGDLNAAPAWTRAAAAGAAMIAALVPAAALVGWAFDLPALRSIFPGSTNINPVAAVCLLTLGLALGAQLGGPRLTWLSRALALGVTLVALLKLATFAGLHCDLDRLLFPSKLDLQNPPSHIAPQTAIELATTGLLLCLGARGVRRSAISELLGLTNGLFAMLALVGYAYRAPLLYGVGGFIPMAPASALVILVLNLGAVAIDPLHPVSRLLTRPGAGGALARRLLPVAVCLPLTMGFVRVLSQRMGFLSLETGTALFALLQMVVLVAMMLLSASALDRSHSRVVALDRQRGHHERLAMIGQLSAGVAHEINNPLAYLITNLKWLADELRDGALVHPEPAELADVLREATEGATRIRDIVADLKTFSRADAEPDPSVRQSCEPRAAIEEAVRMARSRLDGLASVSLLVDANTPRVMMSHRLLTQTLLNLLVNAADALEGHATSQPQVTVRCQVSEAGVDIWVQDNGPGIDPRVSEEIFQPFFTTKGPQKGTGLGLALSREFVVRSGGELTLAKPDGHGATFRMWLPVVA
jgi:signal transduction histidine kinase